MTGLKLSECSVRKAATERVHGTVHTYDPVRPFYEKEKAEAALSVATVKKGRSWCHFFFGKRPSLLTTAVSSIKSI